MPAKTVLSPREIREASYACQRALPDHASVIEWLGLLEWSLRDARGAIGDGKPKTSAPTEMRDRLSRAISHLSLVKEAADRAVKDMLLAMNREA